MGVYVLLVCVLYVSQGGCATDVHTTFMLGKNKFNVGRKNSNKSILRKIFMVVLNIIRSSFVLYRLVIGTFSVANITTVRGELFPS